MIMAYFSLILNNFLILAQLLGNSNILTVVHFPKAESYSRVTKHKGQLSVSLWIQISALTN